jgi:hypothetical protein
LLAEQREVGHHLDTSDIESSFPAGVFVGHERAVVTILGEHDTEHPGHHGSVGYVGAVVGSFHRPEKSRWRLLNLGNRETFHADEPRQID